MDEIYERDVVCGMYLFTTEKCKISETIDFHSRLPQAGSWE